MRTLTIRPPLFPPKVSVELPASKSISNRLLMMRYIAKSSAKIYNLSQAEDTILLENTLSALASRNRSTFDNPFMIDTGNAGTVYRFLTALLTTMPGRWFLTGSVRMMQRPIAPLVDALISLGADISYAGILGFPPLVIDGKNLLGGQVIIDASQSSQFVSALMMIAPLLKNGLSIIRHGKPSSEPYIMMTSKLMQKCGVEVIASHDSIIVHRGEYCFEDANVENDWSSAAFWYEIALLIPGSEFLLKSLNYSVLQGDAILHEFFNTLGVTTACTSDGLLIRRVSQPPASFEADCSGCPDIVPPLAAGCAGSGIKAILKGVETLRYKESDRIEGLLSGLQQFNQNIFCTSSGELVIPENYKPIGGTSLSFHSHGDHRMAMAFAPLCAISGRVRIEQPDVVSKSYPGFWCHLKQAGFEIT